MVMPGLKAPEKAPYAVVFGTYAGLDAGPLEASPTLAIEKLYLQNLYCTVIGQFICPGKEARHEAVDELSDNTGLSVEVASDVLGRYIEDPDSEEFRSMPPHELGKIRAAAGIEDKGAAGMPKPPKEMAHMSEDEFKAVMMANEKRIGGHYDIFNRPNDRDLLKAELYIEEIVKDHFPKDSEGRHPFGGEYIMIS
jgi:hypothetical protein